MMDLERAQELKSSLIWAGVVEEIDKKIHFEAQKLRTCTPEELPLVQAKLGIFESLKRLPDDIIDRES